VSTYVKYVVFQSPTAMKTFLSKHPFSIQLLFFKNIGLHIQKKLGIYIYIYIQNVILNMICQHM